MAQAHRSLRTLAVALAAAVLLGGCPAPSQRPQPPGNPFPGRQPSEPQTPGPLAPIPPPPPRAPPAPRDNHLSLAARSALDPVARARYPRRSWRRRADARPRLAHRAEQSAAVDRTWAVEARGE